MRDVGAISRALADRAEEVCRELLPAGRKVGPEWRVGSVAGEPGSSLGVHLIGPKAGRWRDFADAPGSGGDLIDLAERVKGCTRAEAIEWAREFTGLDNGMQIQKGNGSAPPPEPEWHPLTPIPEDAGQRAPHPRYGKPSRYWIVRDEQGRALQWTCRFDTGDGGKAVLPLTYCKGPRGQREWRWQGLPALRPLYGLDRLAQAPHTPVLIVEGEKAADAAVELFPGDVAVSWLGGCNAVGTADWSPMKGRMVTVWPDNDDPGREAAKAVAAECLAAGAREVRVIDPGRSPEKWDLADELPQGVTVNDLLRMKNAARPFGAAETEAPSSSDWRNPDMSVLQEGRRPPPAFLFAPFGEFWGEWIGAAAEGKSAPPDYVAANLLVVASGLIGNGRRASAWPDKPGAWIEPSILWAISLGPPSSHKSPAADAAFDILRELERSLLPQHESLVRTWEADALTAKAAADAWEGKVKDAFERGLPPPSKPPEAVEPDKPAEPRLCMNDPTPERLGPILAAQPKGCIFYRDELAGWFGNMDRYSGGSGERALWLEAFGGRSFTIDRVKFKDGRIRVNHLSIPVVGGLVPDRAAEILLNASDDGIASRFLYVWPEMAEKRRPAREVGNSPVLYAFRRLHGLQMRVDDNGELQPVVIPLAREAADLFESWWKNNDVSADEAVGLYRSHIGKLPGIVLRLALVLEHLWWAAGQEDEPPSEVGVQAVAQAADLVDDYFKPMAERVFGDAALPPAERDAATIARRILRDRPQVVNARVIRRDWKLPRLREAAPVAAALAVLEDAGWLRAREENSSPKGGRPRADFIVNPAVYRRR